MNIKINSLEDLGKIILNPSIRKKSINTGFSAGLKVFPIVILRS
jgi:hypothetical protein